MRQQFRYVMLTALLTVAVAGFACTRKAADQTLERAKDGSATAIHETQKVGEQVADATKDAAKRTADKTKEIAGETADKTKEIAGDIATETKAIASKTGEAISDTVITTKVSAKFADETVLRGSHINVDTHNQVVTLKGTVASAAAKARAASIASGTEGVKRVVNQLVVT
jgi:hyperosmotically inducible periplasmic protein